MDATTRPPVAALVLAAGGGRRYGGPKALVRLDGALLVERAVATAREAGCAPIVVVLGAAAGQLRATARLDGGGVGSDPTVVIAENADWASGMGSSLRVGLATLAAAAPSAVAAIVLLVDTPGVTTEAVRRLAELATTSAVLARATYDGAPGHPVLLGHDHWAGVAAAAMGDEGARPYLRRHAAAVISVPCGDIADGTDLDVPPTRPGYPGRSAGPHA